MGTKKTKREEETKGESILACTARKPTKQPCRKVQKKELSCTHGLFNMVFTLQKNNLKT
jgi:hypothetical protein